jgi:hypothetical protein
MALFKKQEKVKFEGGGLVLFAEVSQAMTVERALRAEGYAVRLVAPPPELRQGCDLAVEINLVERLGIERKLKEKGLTCAGIEPVRLKTAPLLDVVKVTDYGDWVMVKAGI